jgi:NADPH2:quinone reductase
LGVKKDESHAQYVRNPAGLALGKARQPVDGEASAVGVPYLVSWKALVDAADIQSGETVLITGVAGAVGQAATQIAHWMGATVIGADLGDKPSDADMSINTKDKDLDAEVNA